MIGYYLIIASEADKDSSTTPFSCAESASVTTFLESWITSVDNSLLHSFAPLKAPSFLFGDVNSPSAVFNIFVFGVGPLELLLAPDNFPIPPLLTDWLLPMSAFDPEFSFWDSEILFPLFSGLVRPKDLAAFLRIEGDLFSGDPLLDLS